MKLIFVDTNKELVDKVKKLFENWNFDKLNMQLDTYHWDVFDYKKDNPNFLICTASNPKFNMWWWLDKAIADHYPSEVKNLKEWKPTDNLLPLITVNSDLKATRSQIMRALTFVYVNRYKYNMILTGIWTGIGGMSDDDFMDCLANLWYANLWSANLWSANLWYADLRYADLRYTDLRYANLRYADLWYADLRYADLRYTDLRYADLRSANLRYADLRYADLRYADLRYADLRYADLRSANLWYADLRSANLWYAENRETSVINEATSSFALQCPEEWDFIWRKKCKDNVIVKLKIPAEARRCSATTRKCRAEYVKVLEVIGADVWLSSYDGWKTEYKKWEIVKCDKREEDRWIECWWWIHFFITKREAELYDC